MLIYLVFYFTLKIFLWTLKIWFSFLWNKNNFVNLLAFLESILLAFLGSRTSRERWKYLLLETYSTNVFLGRLTISPIGNLDFQGFCFFSFFWSFMTLPHSLLNLFKFFFDKDNTGLWKANVNKNPPYTAVRDWHGAADPKGV